MEREIPEARRIQDFEGWLRDNALEARPSDEPNLVEQEERARLQEFDAYQESIHRRIFRDVEQQEQARLEQRQKQIRSWKDITIVVYTSGQPLRGVRLQPLAESCDTVYALASSWDQFASSTNGDDNIHVSLEKFSEASVQDFLSLVSTGKTVNDLSGESVVDCCQIAHYLQNSAILEATTTILLESIDNENCLSICQLADQLDLKELFEKALGHMMRSLMALEENETWEDLTPDLQERIKAIKSALESSVHSRQTTLYFSSLEEYVALFVERVQYYRERLADAKELHGQVVPGTKAWVDMDTKIRRQESRVRTLERVLDEQRKVFAGRGLLG